MKFSDDFAALGIQRGEERRGAVPRVVACATLDLPGAHGQHGLRPIEGFDPGFFLGAQHQRLVRGVEIEPDDLARFVDEAAGLWRA